MSSSSSVAVATTYDCALLPACLTGPESTQLLVELAHDLRSPLTAILTLAESMQSGQGGPISDTHRRQLGLIYAAALRLCETTSDTIEYARGTGGPQAAPEVFSLRAMLQDVADTVMPMAEERGVAFTCCHEGPDLRRGNEQALRRILLNLSTNALKVTESGEVRIVARSTPRGRVEFAVIDTGRGLDAAALRHLWEPFRPTAQIGKATFSSAGLGLAICRKLVTEMGGRIQVDSTPNRGSRFQFTVSLPLAGSPRVSSRNGYKPSSLHDTPRR